MGEGLGLTLDDLSRFHGIPSSIDPQAFSAWMSGSEIRGEGLSMEDLVWCLDFWKSCTWTSSRSLDTCSKDSMRTSEITSQDLSKFQKVFAVKSNVLVFAQAGGIMTMELSCANEAKDACKFQCFPENLPWTSPRFSAKGPSRLHSYLRDRDLFGRLPCNRPGHGSWGQTSKTIWTSLWW